MKKIMLIMVLGLSLQADSMCKFYWDEYKLNSKTFIASVNNPGESCLFTLMNAKEVQSNIYQVEAHCLDDKRLSKQQIKNLEYEIKHNKKDLKSTIEVLGDCSWDY